MREEALLKAGEKDERKLEALGGVESHERDARVGIELVGIGGESGVVKEIGESFAALLGVVRGVGQFLQILDAAEGLRRAFGFESFDVAGAVDDEANEFGEGGGIAGGSETFGPFFLRWMVARRDFVPRSPSARDRGHPLGLGRHDKEGALRRVGGGSKMRGVEEGDLSTVGILTECEFVCLRG